MWLVHTPTGEEGWHISQVGQKEPCDLLVFVRTSETGWKTKLWKNTDTRIRAKNREEELADAAVMRDAKFPLENKIHEPAAAAPSEPATSGWRSWLPWPFRR